MTPTALKDLIQACVQALSDNRQGTGDYPVEFIYGRVQEAYIDKLEQKYVNGLKNAVVFFEYRPFEEMGIDEGQGSQEHKVRMHFMKSHKDDARADGNIQIQTEMYNLYLDFMAVLSGNTTTNLSDANKALLYTIKAERTGWQMFDRASNLTAGIIANMTITTKFCRQ